MQNLAKHSRGQLLEVAKQQSAQLEQKDSQLGQQNSQLGQKDVQIKILDDTVKQLEEKIKQLEIDYNKLWRGRFEASSERYIADSNQLRLDFGNSDDAADAAAGLKDAIDEAELIPAHTRKKRKKRDESLPDHLPRYEVVAEVTDEEKHCETHGERTLLPESMWDKTETLERIPAVLKVRVTKYPKYACRNQSECGIVSPERPPSIIEGNKYDSSVAAEIIAAKFSYHLPIYRQQDLFAGSGWAPDRSVLQNILAKSFTLCAPLLAHFLQVVKQDPVIGCDDTGVTLLYPKTLPPLDLKDLKDAKKRRIHEVFSEALDKGKPSINAKMWAYRGATLKLNVFDFTVSRHRDGPESFFADYSGTILGDCWHGFGSIALASDGEILRAGCNSHARRKIRESTSYPADREHWLRWYRLLYDIEDRARPLPADERVALRQAEAQPIWTEMAMWLESVKQRTSNVILPKSDFAQALQYIRNHFTELQRYLFDANIPLDNNETEQLMKQIAIGRKNWLFVGSIAGGERNAGFLTLVSSALRNDLDIWQYVKDVLDQLLAGVTDYDRLLPWNWAADHPDAIRDYRVKERQERAERKRKKRENRRDENGRPRR